MSFGEEFFKLAKDKFALVLFFFLFFIITYFIAEKFGLANTLKTNGAILFLPAGVRLLACLVGRAWGAFGIFWGSFLVVVPSAFPNETSSFHLLIATSSTLSVYLSVVLVLNFLKISNDLSNLKFTHLPFIDLIATLSQAFFFIFILYSANLIEESELLPRFIKQMTGNFLGGMVFMLSFFVLVNAVKLRNTIR
jgi:glucose-6-phosphate-specific signal transduction histidine kinase